MVQTQLLPSSATASLTVQEFLPNPQITSVSWPADSAYPVGASVSISVDYKNYGGSGTIFVRAIDDMSGTVLATKNVGVAEAESGVTALSFSMQAFDFPLAVEVGRDGTVTDSYLGPTLEVLLQVATSLYLQLNPTLPVEPGETVPYVGALERTADPQNPVGVQTINMSVNGDPWVVTTNANGQFSGSFTAPLATGNYIVSAQFLGAGALGASYAETPMGIEGINVGALVVGGAILVALISIFASAGKR